MMAYGIIVSINGFQLRTVTYTIIISHNTTLSETFERNHPATQSPSNNEHSIIIFLSWKDQQVFFAVGSYGWTWKITARTNKEFLVYKNVGSIASFPLFCIRKSLSTQQLFQLRFIHIFCMDFLHVSLSISPETNFRETATLLSKKSCPLYKFLFRHWSRSIAGFCSLRCVPTDLEH